VLNGWTTLPYNSNKERQEKGISNGEENEIEEVVQNSKFNTDEQFMKPSRATIGDLIEKEPLAS
jgi:hypothetical protein